ncbi:unnamed protein product [Trichobilharzia szidati]|nr:unnamed protein product [Trichobilharzia szidati]
MKRFSKKDWKPCELKPIEKEVSKPIPGVPIHFNYGIFFDDDYDYMQHLKSASDTREGYTISVIPEDCPEDDCNPPESPELREPEVDYDEHAVSDLNMDSDAESIDMESEIEDNFVELAGGHAVKDSETESEEGENSKAAENNKPVVDEKPIETDMSKLSRDKVSLMERFLYGTNERSANTSSSCPPDNSSDDDYPDDATIMNKEFEKLVLQYKTRSTCGQSMVSGSSVMSEGLMYALSRDIAIAKRSSKQNDEDLDDELKAITIKKSYELIGNEQEDTESDHSSEEQGSSRNTVISDFNGKSSSSATRYNHLRMPKSGKGKKKSSEKSDIGSTMEIAEPLDPALIVRNKNESADDRRARKAAIKQYRQIRRQIRKANQMNFRQEKERQQRNSTQTMPVY